MKKIIYLFCFITLFSCSKDDAPVVEIEKEVVVPDTTAPIITLTGESTINLTVGDSYTESGSTATDDIDGDLTSSIVISGTVDANTAETYTITYAVSDAAGNAALVVTRTVIVSPVPLVAVVIPALDATGTISEQTVSEAKKTLYGKWNISNSLKSSSSARKAECVFASIEFTSDSYYMTVIKDDQPAMIQGSYIINKDATTEKVISVDLNYNFNEEITSIAKMTNIVVEETDSELNISFDIIMTIPETISIAACADLSKSYSAPKVEPMTASTAAVENQIKNPTSPSNHELLVKSWVVDSVSSDEPEFGDLSSILSEACYDEVAETDADGNYILEANGDIKTVKIEIEGCTPFSSLTVGFSAYGTYSSAFVGGSLGTQVNLGAWDWTDDGQTIIDVGDGTLLNIISLTDTALVLQEKNDGFTHTFTLNAL